LIKTSQKFLWFILNKSPFGCMSEFGSYRKIWSIFDDHVWPSMSGKKSPKWCFGKVFLFQRINQFSDLKLSTFLPIWVQKKSKYILRVKIMYQNSKISAKYAFKVNRPWYLNVPIALIYPSKSTIYYFFNLRTVLFSKKTKFNKKNILWSQKSKMVVKNQNGAKRVNFYWKIDWNATYWANFKLFLDAIRWVLTQRKF
jgi:hypothetical protein